MTVMQKSTFHRVKGTLSHDERASFATQKMPFYNLCLTVFTDRLSGVAFTMSTKYRYK